MHLYYYLKEGAYYVMDRNHKLYRYPKKNNLIQILYLENVFYNLEVMKNEEETFPFKTMEDWSSFDWNTYTHLIEMMAVLENAYLNDSSFLLYGMEAIALHFAYTKYVDFKKKRMQSNAFYDTLLEEELVLVKEKIQLLKSIIDYSKKEVSYAELDCTIEKQFFDDPFNDSYIINAIDTMLVNVYPKKVFRDPSFLDFFSSEEKELELENFMELAHEFETIDPNGIKQKLNYIELLKAKDSSYFYTHFFLFLPFLKKFIDQFKPINCDHPLFSFEYFLLIALFFFYKYKSSSQILTTTENPILKRKIHL